MNCSASANSARVGWQVVGEGYKTKGPPVLNKRENRQGPHAPKGVRGLFAFKFARRAHQEWCWDIDIGVDLMKAKTVFFSLIIWGSSVSLPQAQIRSDFVLATQGITPHIVLDAQKRLHATWAGGGIYYGLFDTVGYAIRPTKKIIENALTNSPRLAVNLDHVALAWTSFIPSACSDVDGMLLFSTTDSIVGSIDCYLPSCNIGTPDISHLNDSTFLTVWTGEGPLTPHPSTGIYGSIFNNSLRCIGDVLLLNNDVPEQSNHINTRIAKRPRYGDTIVIWVAQDSRLGWSVFGRRIAEDGTPLNSTFEISENQNYSFAWGLSAIVEDNQGFTVAWSGQVGDSSWNVYLRRFDANGAPIGSSEMISENPVGRFAEVDLSADNNGNQIVVWEGRTDEAPTILAQRFSANGSHLGANFSISVRPDTISKFAPSVILRDGKIFTAWTEFDSLNGGTIWTNILDFNNPTADIEKHQENFPKSFYLHQNYPNPFLYTRAASNLSTIIKYAVSRRSTVLVVIYNILGENIITLVKNDAGPGTYEVQWNGKNAEGNDVPSGVYLYRLTVNGYSQTRKMLLIR